MTCSPGPKRWLSDEDPLPPADRLREADWRADVEQLYRHRADGLIRHFTGETRDGEGARDLVHEAFSRLASLSFAKRLTISRPESYLFKICLNLFHDRGRAQTAAMRANLLSAQRPIMSSAKVLAAMTQRH